MFGDKTGFAESGLRLRKPPASGKFDVAERLRLDLDDLHDRTARRRLAADVAAHRLARSDSRIVRGSMGAPGGPSMPLLHAG